LLETISATTADGTGVDAVTGESLAVFTSTAVAVSAMLPPLFTSHNPTPAQTTTAAAIGKSRGKKEAEAFA
jgi:hypothetical protein